MFKINNHQRDEKDTLAAGSELSVYILLQTACIRKAKKHGLLYVFSSMIFFFQWGSMSRNVGEGLGIHIVLYRGFAAL